MNERNTRRMGNILKRNTAENVAEMNKSGALINLRWYTIISAIALILLSTVSKLTIGSIEFAGGPALATLAAILLLWPLLRQLATRGGSAEFLGLKLQINDIERRTEEEYAVRLEELRADVEELREEIGNLPRGGVPERRPEPTEVDDSAIRAAIAEYRAHQNVNDWKARVEVDKRLAAGAGRVPIDNLKRLLDETPNDQETAMAVAVSLGLRYPSDDDAKAATLLVELLKNPSERVRYRAARSIERRGRRTDTSGKARKIMQEGVRLAMQTERAEVVLRALTGAVKSA